MTTSVCLSWNWCHSHILAHHSIARLGSRRGFAFALIGHIIWDTRSRVKPSEEEKEKACAFSGGWVIRYIQNSSYKFEIRLVLMYIYTYIHLKWWFKCSLQCWQSLSFLLLLSFRSYRMNNFVRTMKTVLVKWALLFHLLFLFCLISSLVFSGPFKCSAANTRQAVRHLTEPNLAHQLTGPFVWLDWIIKEVPHWQLEERHH